MRTLLTLLLPFTALAAPVPDGITHQGRVLDDTGDPLQGLHNLEIGLYAAQTGGTAAWSDDYDVTLSDGYYAVTLGDDPLNRLTDAILDTSPLWVGITVDSGTPMARMPFNSVPYARRAGNVVAGPQAYTGQATLAPGETLVIDHTASPGFDVAVSVWRQLNTGGWEAASTSFGSTGGSVSFGSGTDGDVTVSGTIDLSTDVLATGRSVADGAAYNVTALTASSATVSGTPSALATGDEVLLINLQGTSSATNNVGNYEFLEVASVSGSTVTFTTSKTRSYGDQAGSDANIGTSTSNQRVVLQRVPHYASMVVNSGAVLTTSAWNGQKGGVLAFPVDGTLAFLGSGRLDVSEKGYRGGDCNGCGNATWGDQGESIGGLGGQTTNRNLTGGGGGYGPSGYSGSPGAGGGHGTAGGDGTTNSGAPNSQGGQAIGSAELGQMFFGGGGGGGGDNDGATPLPQYVDGAGIVYVTAREIDAAQVWAKGEDANGSCNCSGYGIPGAGAGGTIWLSASSLDVLDVDAAGGPACAGQCSGQDGGAGGDGRVRLDYGTLLGTPVPGAHEIILPTGLRVTMPDANSVVVENAGVSTDTFRAIVTVW